MYVYICESYVYLRYVALKHIRTILLEHPQNTNTEFRTATSTYCGLQQTSEFVLQQPKIEHHEAAPVHCNSLWRIETHCNLLQVITTHCSSLWLIVTYCSSLQLIVAHCNSLQLIATHYNTLQLIVITAGHCNSSQHTATHGNSS